MSTLDARLPAGRNEPAAYTAPVTGLAKAALALTYLASATQPWNGWKFSVIRPGDLCLILAVLLFFMSDAHTRLPKLPGWVWQFGAIIVVVTIMHEVIPTDPQYLAGRSVISGSAVIRGNIEVQSNLLVGIKFLVPVIGLPLMYGFAYLHDHRALLRSLYAFAIGTAISSLVGFTDLLGVTRLSQQLTGLPAINGRAPGLSLHPNFLAMTCALALPVLLWQFRSPLVRTRVIAAVLVVATVLGLYASGSRTGAAVGPGAALLSFAIMPRWRRLLPTVALLAGAAMSLVFVLQPSVGHDLLQALRLSGDTGSVSGSDLQRAVVRHQGVLDFLHSPIDGVGLQVAEEAHNVYLQALASGGLPLLIGYLIFVLSAIVKSIRQMKVDQLSYALFVAAIAGALFVIEQAALTDRIGYVPLAIIAVMPAGRAADRSHAVGADPEIGGGYG